MHIHARLLHFPRTAKASLLPLAAALIFSTFWPAPTLQAQALPSVSIMATKPTVDTSNDTPGIFTVSLSTAQTADLKVAYTIKGTAINGTDYTTLSGTKKIKAGNTSVSIKVVPMGTLEGSSSKTVKLILKPGAGYEVSTSKKATVTIDHLNIIILP